MKLATLNLHNGGQLQVFDNNMLENDFIAFEEFQAENKLAFENLLKPAGFSHSQGPDVPVAKECRNSVYVTTKLNAVPVGKPTSINQVKHFWEECAVDNKIHILSLYIPVNSGTWRQHKGTMWDAVIGRASVATSQNEKLIIMGDMNTALQQDCQVGSTTNDSMIASLKNKFGFVDAWEKKHPNCLSSDRWTWYSDIGNGKRLDYVFLSPALKNSLKAAEHIHIYRNNGLTDHSALMVELLI